MTRIVGQNTRDSGAAAHDHRGATWRCAPVGAALGAAGRAGGLAGAGRGPGRGGPGAWPGAGA